MKNKSSIKANLDIDIQMIEGIKKHLLGKTFTLGKKDLTAQDILDVLGGRVSTARAVPPAKSAWAAAVKTARDERATTKALVMAFRAMLVAMYGQAPDILGDFGLTPKKVPAVTAAVKAEAVVKNHATRKARGTMGPVARLKVKGVVDPSPAPHTVNGAAPPTVTAHTPSQ